MNNTLKIVELAKELDNLSVDATDEQAQQAIAAYTEEFNKVRELEQKFYSEFDEEERDSGMCNARDTAVEYDLYVKFNNMVERSSEFWQLAIDSAQLCRDFK